MERYCLLKLFIPLQCNVIEAFEDAGKTWEAVMGTPGHSAAATPEGL